MVTNKKDVRNNLKTHVIGYFLARNGRFPLAFSWEKTVCTLCHLDGQFLQNNTPKPSWVWFSQGLEDSWVDQIFPPNVGNSDTTYIYLAAEVIFLLSLKKSFLFTSSQQLQQEKYYWTFSFRDLFFLSMRNFKTIAVSPRELTILFPRELIWNTFVMGYQPGSCLFLRSHFVITANIAFYGISYCILRVIYQNCTPRKYG